MAVFFAGPLIIIVLLIVLLSAALFVVPQQQAYIIERFGKFLKVQFAGIHIRIPFVDRIAMTTNMRVTQVECGRGIDWRHSGTAVIQRLVAGVDGLRSEINAH